MNLEPVTQSEVSRKEKNKYHILMHIYGVQKDGTDEPICRAAVKNQIMEQTYGHGVEGRKVPQGGVVCVPMTDSLDGWQKPTQYCKAIILQLKTNSKKESRALKHGA